MNTFVYTTYESPVGWIHAASTEKGLCRLAFVETEQEFQTAIAQEFGEECRRDASCFAELKSELDRYFEGKTTEFDIALDVSGTPFQRRIWSELKRVGYGELTTYRDLAGKIGKPNAYRAVGNAVGSNPVPLVVPCHRVIRSNGSIGGFRYGTHLKLMLLTLEGVTLKRNRPR